MGFLSLYISYTYLWSGHFYGGCISLTSILQMLRSFALRRPLSFQHILPTVLNVNIYVNGTVVYQNLYAHTSLIRAMPLFICHR